MGKKIAAYEADDGALFTGKNAKQNMELHERIVKAGKEVEKTIRHARAVFDIPSATNQTITEEDLYDDETTKKEQLFLEKLGNGIEDDYGFDDLILWLLKMRAFNPRAFSELVSYMNNQSTV